MGTSELIVIEKKRIWEGGQDISSLGEEEGQGFYHVDYLFFLWRMERAHVTDYFTGA